MSQPTTTTEDEPRTTRPDAATAPATSRRLRVGAYLILLSGVGLAANGAAILYRALYSSGFEAGVATLGGLTHAELAAQNHELAHYVTHLHVNLAGLMVAAGLAMGALAWFGVRRGQRWALGTSLAIPVVFLAHSIPVHGSASFTYDALAHLGAGVLWLPALLAGGAFAYSGLEADQAD